jgi:hypothetical protein
MQLWGEAATLEAAGETIRLSEDLWLAAADAQASRKLENPYISALSEKLGDFEGKISQEDMFRLLAIPVEKRSPHMLDLVREALATLGWEKKRLRFDGPQIPAYRRGSAEHALKVEYCATQRGFVVQSQWSPALQRPCEKN